MNIDPQQSQAIKRCQQSAVWFLRTFAKIKHPAAGIIDFNPFKYQQHAIKQFRTNRFNIFRKCRQSGASKIAGAFATWFGMFHANKTILIVSRTDNDAMNFLRDNVVFLYNNLPEWMREVWLPVKMNDHEIIFPNGSSIRSLTSHQDVLRSNASSLNIIDEAAFIGSMDVLWAGGWSTLQHGGNVIVISTTNGIGNWYWNAWTDAEAGLNNFNPITINWWDMDWSIEYDDPLSSQHRRIAPTDGIRKCSDQAEIEKYGPYWSPWLEEQYKALQEKGEAWKFEQEILASFVGSGNTVLSKSAINHVTLTVNDDFECIDGLQTYVHPVSGESEDLDFGFTEPDEGLWVWDRPVGATPSVKNEQGEIIQPGQAAYSYTMGVDTATGKGRDYHAIQVLCIDTMTQVAEFMVRCLPRELVKYIDRIGRWYNCALCVVERNNGGDTLIDELRYGVMYPRLWRKKGINDKPRASNSSQARALQVASYGFYTSSSSKATLNKFLLNNIRDNDDDGYKINSKRLLKQIQTYVRKKDRAGRDTGRTEAEDGAGNFDDLVMSFALSLVGTTDIFTVDSSNLTPINSNNDLNMSGGGSPISNEQVIANQKSFIEKGGPQLMMPMTLAPDQLPEVSAQQEIEKYASQLGAIPISDGKPIVNPRKNFYD